MTGSSYIPIVVPIMAFLAMGFWLVLVFYADSHPGYKHRKPQRVPGEAETGETAGVGDDPGQPAHDLTAARGPAQAA